MLQFTVDQEILDELTIDGLPTGLKVGDKVTSIYYSKDNRLDFWYYRMDSYVGDFSDAGEAIKKGVYVRFDQIPFDLKVDLYNTDGTDKYIIPTPQTTSNYGRVVEMGAIPLLLHMQEVVPLLSGKLISGGY